MMDSVDRQEAPRRRMDFFGVPTERGQRSFARLYLAIFVPAIAVAVIVSGLVFSLNGGMEALQFLGEQAASAWRAIIGRLQA